jgi:hypothetical protein
MHVDTLSGHHRQGHHMHVDTLSTVHHTQVIPKRSSHACGDPMVTGHHMHVVTWYLRLFTAVMCLPLRVNELLEAHLDHCFTTCRGHNRVNREVDHRTISRAKVLGSLQLWLKFEIETILIATSLSTSKK